ncbi:hypothetical protein H4219_001684 [Mycoemilia scoparia]|uniref:Phosphoinositide phospholipase C n=1 Tax=Mycoemilia scoparia TaxID=417184 RepID=A0A9W8A8Y0_9FUNG|nr:hypothetical protein H4219_001684 [Mycoemilia scoparia]
MDDPTDPLDKPSHSSPPPLADSAYASTAHQVPTNKCSHSSNAPPMLERSNSSVLEETRNSAPKRCDSWETLSKCFQQSLATFADHTNHKNAGGSEAKGETNPRTTGDGFHIPHKYAATVPNSPFDISSRNTHECQTASWPFSQGITPYAAITPPAMFRDDECCREFRHRAVHKVSRIRMINSQIFSSISRRHREHPLPCLHPVFPHLCVAPPKNHFSSAKNGILKPQLQQSQLDLAIVSSESYPLSFSYVSLCQIPSNALVGSIPPHLHKGTDLIKATSRKFHERNFRIDMSQQRVIWNSKKKKKLAHIDLESIIEIRVGREAEWAMPNTDGMAEEFRHSLFAIVYRQDGETKSVCVAAHSHDIFVDWVRTLKGLLRARKPADTPNLLKQWQDICIRRMWWESEHQILKWNQPLFAYAPGPSLQSVMMGPPRIIGSGSGSIPATPRSRSRQPSFSRRPEKFVTSVTSSTDSEAFLMFQNLMRSQFNMAVAEEPFAKACENTDSGMTFDEFKTFIKIYQKESYDEHILREWFKVYTTNGVMTRSSFTAFLRSSLNALSGYRPDSQKLHDMSYPINDYYIASSHNTYLLSNQIVGASSIEGYARALQRGCRCVERKSLLLDISGITTRILFKDAIETILQYAFETSPYPVVLSLENHCTLAQQQRMASILQEILGDFLLTKKFEKDIESQLPSPEDLKYKIIVKNKVLSPTTAPSTAHRSSSMGTSGSSTSRSSSNTSTSSSGNASSDSLSMTPNGSSIPISYLSTVSAGSNCQVAPELSNLIVYCKAIHLDEDKSLSEYHYDQVISMSEKKVAQLIRENKEKLVALNRKIISRVYPYFSRVNSGNFNPLSFWGSGCQMVALNYQTPDKSMQINDALFRTNGYTGYILKPSYLRHSRNHTSPQSFCKMINISILQASLIRRTHLCELYDEKSEITCHLEFISDKTTATVGSNSMVDFIKSATDRPVSWLNSETDSEDSDCSSVNASCPSGRHFGNEEPCFCVKPGATATLSAGTTYTTAPGMVCGLSVKWQNAKNGFLVPDPHLAFIRFSILNDDDEIASTCLSIESIKQGYRYIELVPTSCVNGGADSNSTSKIYSTDLLVHIDSADLAVIDESPKTNGQHPHSLPDHIYDSVPQSAATL